MADLTAKAFDLADKYRMPAMLLADGTMGQMMEPVQLPEQRDPDTTDKDWAVTGWNEVPARSTTSSTPCTSSPAELERLNIERFERYAEIEKNETHVGRVHDGGRRDLRRRLRHHRARVAQRHRRTRAGRASRPA